jgi:hypothetical protein
MPSEYTQMPLEVHLETSQSKNNIPEVIPISIGLN